MSTPPVTISDWKPVQRNSLRGFLTAHLPSGMTIHELAIHFRDGTWWMAPPRQADAQPEWHHPAR